jgi:hypothetical protein
MATIPRFTPTATLAPITGPRATADAFGGLAAESTGRVAQAGFSLAAGLKRIQEQDDARAVLSAEAKMKQAASDKQIELTSLTGENAVNVTKQGKEFWDSTYRDVEKGLGNPRQKQLLRERMSDASIMFGQTLSQHEVKQRRVATVNTAQASRAAATSFAAANAHNPDAVAVGRNEVITQSKYVSQENGDSKEIASAQLKANLTDFHQQIIENLVREDPGVARQYFKSFKGEIDGTKYDDIDKLIALADNKAAAMDAGDAIGLYKSEEDHLAAYRKSEKDADKRAAGVTEIKARWAETRRIKEQNQHAAFGKAQRQLSDSGGRISAIDSVTLSQLSDEQRALLPKIAATIVSGGGEREYDAFLKLWDLGISRDASFKKQFSLLEPTLLPSHKEALKQFRDAKDINAFTTVQRINAAIPKMFGGGSLSKSEQEAKGRFITEVQAAIDAASATKGKKLSGDEEQKIIDSASRAAYLPGGLWRLGIAKKTFAFDLKPEDIAVATPDEDTANKIKAHLKANGVQDTPEKVNEFFRLILRKRLGK